MLPPKIGEGVFGSNSGGVNPTGAGAGAGAFSVLTGVSVLSSADAAVLIVVLGEAVVNLIGLSVMKDKVDGCFHGLGVERGGVKREAWVAMAMEMETDIELSEWGLFVRDQ